MTEKTKAEIEKWISDGVALAKEFPARRDEIISLLDRLQRSTVVADAPQATS